MKQLLTYREVHEKAVQPEYQTPELVEILRGIGDRLLSGEQISEFPKKVVDAVQENTML